MKWKKKISTSLHKSRIKTRNPNIIELRNTTLIVDGARRSLERKKQKFLLTSKRVKSNERSIESIGFIFYPLLPTFIFFHL